MDPIRLFHTVRHLKPAQVYGRIWFRFHRPRPDTSPAPSARQASGPWRQPPFKASSFFLPDRFRFLNIERTVSRPTDWNHPEWEKLWLYNLHYFDDLNSADATEKEAAHSALIRRWIDENPPAKGNGWEPYPTSLRIVNWIKWLMAGHQPAEGMVHSMAVQTRYLAGRLERHLLGNHLFANAKAMYFSGLFFKGSEAEKWLNKGLRILKRELREQVLPDGGHFERSPMYHAIIFEDLLDIINLSEAFALGWRHGSSELVSECRQKAGSMIGWLKTVSHPDGNMVLFNDAAFGIAASLDQLIDYGARLGVVTDAAVGALDDLNPSGYIRLEKGPAVAFLDVAPIGPDYLPGHAHADTLTFELSLFGRRLIVDSGTSVYGDGPERQRQRSTAAHNTVEIDGENSSEVWGGFRVARRGRPKDLLIREENGEIRIGCAHDGYRRLPGKPVHRRQWRLTLRSLTIEDTIAGKFDNAVARLHFHPAVSLEGTGNGIIYLPDGNTCRWRVIGGTETRIVDTTYHPEFGLSLANQCLEIAFTGNQIKTEIDFHPCTSSF